jgi:DMSO/TMAO reductase YedYZ molybdopterin-dependent catalytic subunit
VAKSLQSSSVGLIIRQQEPKNLETPFEQVDSYLTPMELFFIRSHFPAPKLELASYQLHIDGAVRIPFSLSYKQLRDMPSETRVATLECAGNSRVFLIPQVAGAQWELGAVGNAEWTGVPLGALLERAGLEEDACEAVREPFRGYWQTSDYGYWDDLDGKPVRRALGEMKLKSEIARPRVYETVASNQVYTVSGAAWAGETEVTGICVSTDGGQTWAEAEFLDPVQRHAWRRWKFDWLTPKKPGRYTLLAQAKDANGSVQPDRHDPNNGSYVINHPLPIEVFVDDPRGPSA